MKEISVSEPWFSLMKHKKKRIEGRLNKGTFAELQKGEIVKFVNNNDSFTVKIKKIIKYDTFKDYLSQEGLKRTLPNIKTIDEGCNIYYKYYTKEQEKEFKILAICVMCYSKRKSSFYNLRFIIANIYGISVKKNPFLTELYPFVLKKWIKII
jgi:ASC-1-like (ASCH) protein